MHTCTCIYCSIVVAGGPTDSVAITSSSDIDFTNCPDIPTAFSLLTVELHKLLKRANFAILKFGVLKQRWTPGGIEFPDDLQRRIKAARELDTLLDVLVDSGYWNWVDLRLPSALIVSSGIQEAELLIQNYINAIFPKKLSDILPLPQQKEQKDAYISRVAAMIEKEPNEITVRDLARNSDILEAVIMDINNGSCVLKHLSTGQGHQSKSESGKAQVVPIVVLFLPICMLRYVMTVPLEYYHAGAFSHILCFWNNRRAGA